MMLMGKEARQNVETGVCVRPHEEQMLSQKKTVSGFSATRMHAYKVIKQ